MRPHVGPGFCVALVPFGPRGRPLGSVLAPFGALCTESGAKTTLKTVFERRRRPRELPKPKRPQSSQPTGLHFGTEIHEMFRKAWKNVSYASTCFFRRFWVAPGAPRDGLICNPLTPSQSKHTSPFSELARKNLPKELLWAPVWRPFGTNVASNGDF